jgi:hypothetical protein
MPETGKRYATIADKCSGSRRGSCAATCSPRAIISRFSREHAGLRNDLYIKASRSIRRRQFPPTYNRPTKTSMVTGWRRSARHSLLFCWHLRRQCFTNSCRKNILFDFCIKNAILRVLGQNTYAQTERERRPTRRSAQASLGVAGFRLLSQRSGTAHWLQSKFGDALARYSTEGRSQGIARTLLPRTTAEVGSAASTALGQPSSAEADDARLSNESLDHRPHCGIDPEPVRNPVPPRSRGTLDA